MDRREESGRVFGLTRLLLQMRGSDSPSHRRSLVTWPLQADLSQSNSAFERRLSSTAVRQVFAVQLSPRAAHSSKSLLVRLNIARG